MDSTSRTEKRSQLIEALEALLASRIGVVEASRMVTAMQFDLGQDRNPLFYPFVGINSLTDTFPLGEVRELWASQALARYDQERELAEERYASFAAQSATALLTWARATEF